MGLKAHAVSVGELGCGVPSGAVKPLIQKSHIIWDVIKVATSQPNMVFHLYRFLKALGPSNPI